MRDEVLRQAYALQDKRERWKAASARYYEKHPEVKEKKRVKAAERRYGFHSVERDVLMLAVRPRNWRGVAGILPRGKSMSFQFDTPGRYSTADVKDSNGYGAAARRRRGRFACGNCASL